MIALFLLLKSSKYFSAFYASQQCSIVGFDSCTWRFKLTELLVTELLHFALSRFWTRIKGLPRRKNLRYFSLVSLVRAGDGFRHCLILSLLFCFLHFTSSVILIGSYTLDECEVRLTTG